MGTTTWWAGGGARRRAMLCGAAVVLAGTVALPVTAGASSSPTAKWFAKYGGHLKAVSNDIDTVAQSSNAQLGQACRSLNSDASEVVFLPAIPSKVIKKAMRNAAKALSEGAIECQGFAAGSTDVSEDEVVADLKGAVAAWDVVVNDLKKDGLLLSHVKAKHAVVPKSTPTTTTPTNHVGDTLSTSTISIQLQQVIDPAQSDNEFETPDSGNRFVAVKVQISNPGTDNIEDDANNDFTVIGSDGQIYTADFDTIAGCTNFNDGEYGLTPGASVVGCVTFQIPTGVNVTQVDFVGSDSRAQWQVP